METSLFQANLEYYKAFYAVAHHGSITAAAHALCLTQPTVTSAIHRLEKQLGCTLFVRGKKGVQLTSEGQILWRKVEPAMRLLQSGEAELRQAQNLEGGTLRLVATEMGYRSYLIPTLEHFTQDYPKVKVRFRNALTENVLDMVRRGEADLALLHAPFPSTEDLALRYLDKIEECFVVGPRYRFLSESPHALADLTKYPMISVPEGAATKQFLSALFAQRQLTYEPDIEVTTIDLVIQAVEHDFGIASLPTSVAQARIRAGTMFRVPVTEPPLERKAYVITSKLLPLSPAAQTFLDDYLFWQG
jgi:DNA-binding transcriptional LysR family regulator